MSCKLRKWSGTSPWDIDPRGRWWLSNSRMFSGWKSFLWHCGIDYRGIALNASRKALTSFNALVNNRFHLQANISSKAMVISRRCLNSSNHHSLSFVFASLNCSLYGAIVWLFHISRWIYDQTWSILFISITELRLKSFLLLSQVLKISDIPIGSSPDSMFELRSITFKEQQDH